MSYILNKPYTEKEKTDFIVKYNHQQGLSIEETTNALYALEAWELLLNDEIVDNMVAWQQVQAEKDAERIANLKLTKREVFLALYNDVGITPEIIKSNITDPIAIIEFEYANEYYRGNPLIDVIGKSLGYSKEQLDYLFENKSFPLRVEEPIKEADVNA